MEGGGGDGEKGKRKSGKTGPWRRGQDRKEEREEGKGWQGGGREGGRQEGGRVAWESSEVGLGWDTQVYIKTPVYQRSSLSLNPLPPCRPCCTRGSPTHAPPPPNFPESWRETESRTLTHTPFCLGSEAAHRRHSAQHRPPPPWSPCPCRPHRPAYQLKPGRR